MTTPLFRIPALKPQEVSFDHPASCCRFQLTAAKPFVATPAALNLYGLDAILACLAALQRKAQEHDGVDYLQVFTDPAKDEALWFVEDGDGGAITALLPSDY